MISITFLFAILSIVILGTSSAADAFSSMPTLSSKSSASYSRNIAVSLAPTPSDFADALSILQTKLDVLGKKTSMLSKANNEDVAAQVLSDISHALVDFYPIFKKAKQPKLRMRYAQLVGRIITLGITMMPHHGVCPEDAAFQLYLLGASTKPIIRSIKLYKCIADAKCTEENALGLNDIEDSLL
uniref:Uncharacterized protein n=1 Tax=Pseudo-nitzschia australis TaxID=44445 RepID=A0A7S4ACD2_9STRA|eukprot:CAMPEP_0168294390 /NCGR_PEP_ID=MMETSP0142_2-20121227/8655_1 /TAXON_ID=44445 /ORGANISM="Pseudo-nitzschia australis, Strain 10249 10 AB" /LENGTH=184 /DNA_ID=CAMNT_0008242723 /DNA_START=3 /DNA_END=557 /DNA_ORIENTATION=+